MQPHHILAATQIETDIQLDMDTRMALQSYKAEEGQVILHITYFSTVELHCIRIWPSTYLLPKSSSDKVVLIHAENIGLYPRWLGIPPNKPHIFTLVFGALPKDCTSFDLLEDIPEPGGFFIPNIKRNKLDVYHLRIH
jgi:hypothetical protein